MKLNDLLKELGTKRNGQFFKMKWISNLENSVCAAAKKTGVVVTKEVISTVRKGIRYGNIKSVKEKFIQKGEFSIDPFTGEVVIFPEKMHWGEYVEGLENLIIKHNNNYYVRLYTTPNKSNVRYFLNGQEISKEDLQKTGILRNSYWTRKPVEECMTLRVDSIQKIY